MKSKINWQGWSSAVMILFIAIFSISLFNSMSAFWDDKQDERIDVLEQAIKRAAIQCYALEGSYPPDLQYLSDHYGIIINKERYYYQYDIFASNILPDIGVFEKPR